MQFESRDLLFKHCPPLTPTLLLHLLCPAHALGSLSISHSKSSNNCPLRSCMMPTSAIEEVFSSFNSLYSLSFVLLLSG